MAPPGGGQGHVREINPCERMLITLSDIKTPNFLEHLYDAHIFETIKRICVR